MDVLSLDAVKLLVEEDKDGLNQTLAGRLLSVFITVQGAGMAALSACPDSMQAIASLESRACLAHVLQCIVYGR